jgi:hypothetical protein
MTSVITKISAGQAVSGEEENEEAQAQINS